MNYVSSGSNDDPLFMYELYYYITLYELCTYEIPNRTALEKKKNKNDLQEKSTVTSLNIKFHIQTCHKRLFTLELMR